MAKSKSSSDSRKVVFFKTKGGKAKKSRNKHDRKSRVYRGQGRV
jgi:hypothetical protein|tara:strand:- start:1093 stop:1224 length:132 start_codon:yes stop_codon:yes gene_type:complete